MRWDFFKGKRVLITGHTGFKGAWLCKILNMVGADVYGYALEPPTEPSLYALLKLSEAVDSTIGDVRDLTAIRALFDRAQPEIVFHLAAQPIVRTGYQDPAGTYGTNIMGTVHVLECVRQTSSVKSVINVTSDKVYQNKEWPWAYRENEALDGFDPYANSKSCAELVTGCYRRSFFEDGPAVSTVRAGNVIGGGDFAGHRIIPDCVRAVTSGQEIVLRNPHSVRPYQHVLDALDAYLTVAEAQYTDCKKSGAYNVGPGESDLMETQALARCFCEAWGHEAKWTHCADNGPHEDQLLRIDSSFIKQNLRWQPHWTAQVAVEMAVKWYRCWSNGGDVITCIEKQILDFQHS